MQTPELLYDSCLAPSGNRSISVAVLCARDKIGDSFDCDDTNFPLIKNILSCIQSMNVETSEKFTAMKSETPNHVHTSKFSPWTANDTVSRRGVDTAVPVRCFVLSSGLVYIL